MAQLVGHCPIKGKVTGSIPGQGKSLGFVFSPGQGHVGEAPDQCFCLTSMFLSLSFSLPSPLSINKIFLKKDYVCWLNVESAPLEHD